MRMTKTDQLKTDLEIYAQNNHRELDSKEAFLQMLDKNLDEAEDQYNLALRNHLIQIDKLQEIRDARISALNNEFAKAAEILYDEFSREADELMRNHNRQTKEMNDMMETVQDEEADKTMQSREIFQTFREETKDKALEEMENLQNEMNSKQVNLSNYLETLYQKYMNDTKDKFENYTQLMGGNETQSKKIDEDMKKIARTKEKIHVTTIKILMMEKEFHTRTVCLNKEKSAIGTNFLDLKTKMGNFRDKERKRLTELVLNSKSAVEKLRELAKLGEKNLKTAELCRRLETEKEKVVPFYESTIDENEIPEDLRTIFNEITNEEFKKFSYLKNYFKRYNKIMLDKLAIQKQKELYLKENQTLKSLLKQHIDGISVNDDVIRNENPLIVTNKAKLEYVPIQRVPKGVSNNILCIDGREEITKITMQGNVGQQIMN